jgi:hypothetical protein
MNGFMTVPSNSSQAACPANEPTTLADRENVSSRMGKTNQPGYYDLNPLEDKRWAVLVQEHPQASVFHSVAWLKSLHHTYGYEPIVFTTSPPGVALRNGLVFCRINSWLTGRRLVSLPFSDHCEPLCGRPEELQWLVRCLRADREHQSWKYLEIRPTSGDLGLNGDGVGFVPSAKYFRHNLDLRPDRDSLFRALHKDSVQRRIRRAEQAGVVEKYGDSAELLEDFYSLFVLTRARHRVPPSPKSWFQSLRSNMGEALEIRVAYKDQRPISAILTLRFKDTVYFKYGCSNARFHRYGATPWLLWRAIESAKANGALQFDMGRTLETDAGLLAFKSHWVSEPEPLVYWKVPNTHSLDSLSGWGLNFSKLIFACLPNRLLTVAGKLLYPHIG